MSRKSINKQLEPWAEKDIEVGSYTIGMELSLEDGFVWKEGEVWMSDEVDPQICLFVPIQIGGGYLEVRAQYYKTSDTEKMEMGHRGKLLTRWKGASNRDKWTDLDNIDRDEIIADARGCTAFKLWVHTINTWTKVLLQPEPDTWYMPMWIVKEKGDPENDEDWEKLDYIKLPESEPETPTPDPQIEHTKGLQFEMKKQKSGVEKELPLPLQYY